jgi:hypothetical protein
VRLPSIIALRVFPLPDSSDRNTMKTYRRIFLARSAFGLLATGSAPIVFAMAGPVTDEKDPKAQSLGYRADGSKVDTSKYPAYAKKS